MRTILILTAALGATIHAAPARAADLPQLRFQHHDWELACDNTRSCRAAGYHVEEGDNAPVTVLLERRAGAGTPFTARIMLGDEQNGNAAPAALAMSRLRRRAMDRQAA